jgi:hypothetical protein
MVFVFAMAIIILPLATHASTLPPLGTAGVFGILSSTFTRNVGVTIITGSVGYTTLSGGGSNTVSSTTYTPSPSQAGVDQSTAISDINSQVISSCTDITGQGPLEGVVIGANPPGTFPAGCYKSDGAMAVTANGIVTLDGGGDPDSVFIFKPGGSLTTGDNSIVKLSNSASACNVFWSPVGATTLGAFATATTSPVFVGNIFRGDADGLSITLGHFSNILGRALAFGSTVTADTNIFTTPTCGGVTPGTLHVIKNVDNTAGGTATSSDFNLSVKISNVNIAGSPSLGTTTPGTLYLLSANTYTVSESTIASYTTSYSGDCVDGVVTLAAGGDKTCIVTNTYVLPTPTPVPTPSYSVSSGGGSIHYGCKDMKASNYEYFAASNPALCLYGIVTSTIVSSTSTYFTTVYSDTVSATSSLVPKFPKTGIADGVGITKSEAISSFYRSLHFGSKGGDVSDLQTALTQKGFLVIPVGISKGYFGSMTKSAVAKYQKRSDLPSIGVFGPQTKARLISELSE